MKKIISAVIFIALIVLTTVSLNNVTRNSDARVYQWQRCIYYQEKNSLDAVMLGASNVYSTVEAPLAWERYGISLYPYCAPNQPFEVTEFMLKEARKTQPDAIYIIFVNSFYIEEFDSAKMHWTTDYMKLSRNKVDLINYLCENMDEETFVKAEYYFPLLRYHTRFDSLTEEDFVSGEDGVKGGAYYKKFLTQSKDVTKYYNDTLMHIVLPQNVSERLESLLDYCDENNVKAVFVSSPQIRPDDRHPAWNVEILRRAAERGYDTVNMYDLLDEIGIDMTKDYYNYNHLNVHGAIKTTNYLAEYIAEKYDLENKKGKEGCSDWDDAVVEYNKTIAPYILDIEKQTEKLDYSITAPVIDSIHEAPEGITVSWQPVEGVSGYVVYRKSTDPELEKNAESAWEKLATVDDGSCVCNDSGLTRGFTYTYTVVPYVEDGDTVIYGDHDYSGKSTVARFNTPVMTETEEIEEED